MLCCGCKKGREATPDIATSPRRQNVLHGTNNAVLRPKEHPSMVIQGDFRKVSGISNEIFRQIETIENEYDASTAAALEAVERRGEMIVRILDTKHLGKAATEAARKFFTLQDAKHTVLLVEIIKRPGQTLGLYIREGNGLDRSDGVFISRIALESAVYNSNCIQVGDEILAVNLVDVTHMSIDDVVIIMSIPRRLVLVTRQAKGYPSAGTHLGMGRYATLSHGRPPEQKPPPVVVIKKDLSRNDDDMDDDDEEKHLLHSSRFRSHTGRDVPPAYREKSKSQYALDSNSDLGDDLYYNSRPQSRRHQTSTLDRRIGDWRYTPQSSILDHPRRQTETNNLHSVYDRMYPKTLESLAEKVHPFCPTGRSATLGRRPNETALSRYSQANKRFGITRSGSDQHLARTEFDNFSRTLPRQSQTLLRSNFRTTAAGSGVASMGSTYSRQYGAGSGLPSCASSGYTSTLLKRHNVVDYASDTEASYPSVSKSSSSSYYYCKPNTPQTISGISSSTLSRLTKSGALSRASSMRSNSLPRDIRRNQLSVHTPVTSGLSNTLSSALKYGREPKTTNLLDSANDGNISVPEFSSSEKLQRGNFLPSATNVFTSNEYRSWLSRTPSTSAIYDRLKSNRDSSSLLKQKSRFTFSAENLPERTRQSEFLSYSKYRPGQLASMGPVNTTPLPSATITTLDRHTRTSSLRRLRQLQELEAKHLGNRAAVTPDVQVDRSRVLEINTTEFIKYKLEKSHLGDDYPPISGLLWIHLLAGRGLRVNATGTVPLSEGGVAGGGSTRDLYCVLECDRIHKARTVVRNGDLVFDWDETFELDLFNNRELDFLVYSWDPQYRHKLCYKGSIQLSSLLYKSPIHQLALKVEPRGTLYLRIRHTNAYHTYLRKPSRPLLPSRSLLSASTLFGTDLDTVVNNECESISVSMQQLPQSPLVVSVPIIVRRCVEEIERRGLDIIGLYRLCGSATKKRILREAFERNPRSIDLSPDNVPDINVITGVFKDYLRELPEPLFTKHLYQMIVDALSVCMSDDPQGNAKLIFSLLDCLSRANRATLVFVMDHLSMVVSQSMHNKMNAQSLSTVFSPLLMIKSENEDKEVDFNQPINILRYLLEVWPSKSAREMITGAGKTSAVHTAHPPPLPKKQSAVSAPAGGPLPIPSKGIRKPPPAVPARYTRVAAVSPITEGSSSTTSSSSDGASTVVSAAGTIQTSAGSGRSSSNSGRKELPSKSNVSTKASMFEEGNRLQPTVPQVLFRPASTSFGSRSLSSEDYSNIPALDDDDDRSSNISGVDSDPYSSKGKHILRETTRTFNERDSNAGFSIQTLAAVAPAAAAATKVDPVKIEQALKEISNTTKPPPSTSFGHSRVNIVGNGDKQGIITKVVKSDNASSPWDTIVESWINEADNDGADDSEMVAAALSESFKRSHKNPFLSDLLCGGGADMTGNRRERVQSSGPEEENKADRYRGLSSNFAFCFDATSSFATSNNNSSAGKLVENRAAEYGKNSDEYEGGSDRANRTNFY